MKHYVFKSNAIDEISNAGIAQAELARQADVDKVHLNKRLANQQPMRHATAARIARAFAELTRMSQEEAMSRLFEEES